MTQAGPLTLAPATPLASASGWLPRIGTLALLVGMGLLVLPPLLYLAAAAVTAGELGAVTIVALVGLAFTTLSLATLATIWAMLLALPLAWLVIRTDLPFRTLCRWLAVIPLAIPSYIGAMSYIALLGPVGSVSAWLSALLGTPQQWVNIYGFWGGVFVLGLFTYPYIFLLVSAALEATNPAVEETARSLGDSPLGVFRRVTLPMLRPSMLAGGLLAFLYALSDFGSPSLLRVQVFTTAIYHQLNTRFDQAAAAMLSFVLVLITIAVLIGQHMLLRRRSYVTITGTARVARPLHLGRWRWPAALLAGMVLSLSVFIPLGVLLAQTGSLGHFLEVVREQGDYIKNSLLIAGLAATLAAILGLLIAFTARHTPPRTGALLSGTIQIGYAIPGTVLGLSLILLYNTYIPWVYGTVGVLVVAYLIRFLTQSVQGAAVDGGHAAAGEETGMTLIDLSQVSLTYPQAAAPALSDLTLAVEEGATLSILGPSGCGKTTVLRAIAGFERPQTGAITISDRPVCDAAHWVVPEERGVGMVFQDYALFPHLTVAENVAFGLQRLEKAAAARTVAQTLNLVGLSGFEDRYPHELSGGQQQRVALARARAPKPIVLLLDEPLSNLDHDMRGQMPVGEEEIVRLSGTTAVLVTHDHDEAFAMADRVAVLNHGRLEQVDTPEAIYHTPSTPFVGTFVDLKIVATHIVTFRKS